MGGKAVGGLAGPWEGHCWGLRRSAGWTMDGDGGVLDVRDAGVVCCDCVGCGEGADGSVLLAAPSARPCWMMSAIVATSRVGGRGAPEGAGAIRTLWAARAVWTVWPDEGVGALGGLVALGGLGGAGCACGEGDAYSDEVVYDTCCAWAGDVELRTRGLRCRCQSYDDCDCGGGLPAAGGVPALWGPSLVYDAVGP